MIPIQTLQRIRRMKYQIEPHLRYDFDHPPPWGGRPPRPPRTPRPKPPRLARWTPQLLWQRFRLWYLRQAYRFALWLAERLPHSPQQDVAALQLLILVLTMVVLFQALLLVLVAR